MESTLSYNTHSHWLENDLLSEIFERFKFAVHIVSTNDNPMSSAYPLVCALKNEVYNILESDRFDRIMGHGAGDVLKSILEVRFNLDGIPPEGRKVGILDSYHIWCSLMDPYFRDLKLKVPREMSEVKKMIKFFVPKRSEVELQRALLREYQFFKSGTGSYQSLFGDDFADNEVEEKKSRSKNTMKTISIEDVSKWVKRTGGHMGRLAWFSTWKADSILYQKIGKPLMSLRSTGSMTVERAAKPMKNSVYTKFRRRLSPGRSSMLLRVGLNLRFLAETKLAMLLMD